MKQQATYIPNDADVIGTIGQRAYLTHVIAHPSPYVAGGAASTSPVSSIWTGKEGLCFETANTIYTAVKGE